MQFTNDELILMLVSVVRVVNPRMLESGADGFTVDLAPLQKKAALSSDEQLLLKLYAALAEGEGKDTMEVEFVGQESERLRETILRLERVQDWPADVLAMSRDIQQRLQGASE
jgi:hypothetical protein